MRVASIHVYPVKSCYRTSVDRAAVQPWGLAGDRRWLIVSPEDGIALTQRDLPALTRIRPCLAAEGLVLATPSGSDLHVPHPVEGELVDVTVWASTIAARVAGTAADAWLTARLRRPVRLVWLDDPTRRRVDPEYAGPDDRVSFADGYPLLLGNPGPAPQRRPGRALRHQPDPRRHRGDRRRRRGRRTVGPVRFELTLSRT